MESSNISEARVVHNQNPQRHLGNLGQESAVVRSEAGRAIQDLLQRQNSNQVGVRPNDLEQFKREILDSRQNLRVTSEELNALNALANDDYEVKSEDSVLLSSVTDKASGNNGSVYIDTAISEEIRTKDIHSLYQFGKKIIKEQEADNFSDNKLT